jgi:hypothetical protein
MIVASRMTPAASPVANTFKVVSGADAIDAKARNRMSAALVTRRPVRPIPRTTAVSGRGTLHRARRLAGGAQNELLAPLDDTERAQLHDLLLRLVAGLGAMNDPIGFRDSPPPPTGDG